MLQLTPLRITQSLIQNTQAHDKRPIEGEERPDKRPRQAEFRSESNNKFSP